jgi:hypothetical protein
MYTMNKTHEEFLQKIDDFYNDIKNSNINDILDIDYLTSSISNIGLYNESDRRHPENNNVHLYGDDVKYMNIIPNVGMWQIPRQLAGFLIKLVSLGNVETFLDIGTCRGATITVIAIFLSRFGIKKIDTVDIINYLHDDLKKKWEELNLPITYIIIPINSSYKDFVSLKMYDVIFIDGNHDYNYVLNDYQIAKNITSKICFHDINDCFCVDVVRLWNEIKNSKEYQNMYEFTHHSHNYKLMGIGLILI